MCIYYDLKLKLNVFNLKKIKLKIARNIGLKFYTNETVIYF